MSFDDYCAGCTNLGGSPYSDGMYWCSELHEKHFACESRCSRFCRAYNRSYDTCREMYENSRSHMNSSGGCYLTTIVTKILNYPDSNPYLNTLRCFRDNVMKTNVKYYPLLITYDTIGPIISYLLSIDKNREVIANNMFNDFIVPACDAINEGKNEEAINIYTNMTNVLARKYNVNTNIVINENKAVDMESLGHARVLIPN